MEKQNNEKELTTLQASFDMYEHTKKDTKRTMKAAMNADGTRKYSDEKINETIKLIEESQSDICEKYKMAGGNVDDLKAKKTNKKAKVDTSIFEQLEAARLAKKQQKEEINIDTFTAKETIIPVDKTYEGTSKALYDVIPIPSNGECYKHKKAKVPVSYLTAYDENLIVSPNLYRDGTFIDYLLKEKIMNSNIDPSDLIAGDRDAIILWLRASGYGNEFPVTATDNKTGVQFETIVDLSKIKFKEFNLKGDENGYFDFTLPISGDKIKFKFLTYKDEKSLELIETMEDEKLKKDKLNDINETLNTFIENDDKIDKKLRIRVNEAIRTLETWVDEISDEDSLKFTHAVTNKLEMSIMSINDVTDRKFIKDYVLGMNVKDASSLRRYITENEPGLDFNIEVQKPESLGGGSMPMFLTLDQFIFLNIA